MDIFAYNNQDGTISLNTPEILLIKEFGALMGAERNKTKKDPK